MHSETAHRILRFLLVLFACICSIFLIMYVSAITYPFLIGTTIALLINPMVNTFEKKFKLHRGFAVCLALLCLFGMTGLLITLLIQEIITGFAYLAHVIPIYTKELVLYMEAFFRTDILPLYQNVLALISKLNTHHQETVMGNIQKIGNNITRTVSTLAQGIINGISNLIVSLPSFISIFVFSLLASFFISKDWFKLTGYIERFLPESLTRTSKKVYAELRKALFGFIKAQLTLISITACIVLIGLLLLRIEYAITISVIIGLIDLIPYLGTGAVFLPWIAYCFFTKDFHLTIGLSVLYGIVVIQRQVMEPKILSSSIGLDPLATLISLFVGFKWFGFLGLIFGPVLLITLRALFEARFFHELYRYIHGATIKK